MHVVVKSVMIRAHNEAHVLQETGTYTIMNSSHVPLCQEDTFSITHLISMTNLISDRYLIRRSGEPKARRRYGQFGRKPPTVPSFTTTA